MHKTDSYQPPTSTVFCSPCLSCDRGGAAMFMFVRINGRRIYPFNKGLRIYGGVYHLPFDTLKKCTSAYDMNLKLYRS